MRIHCLAVLVLLLTEYQRYSGATFQASPSIIHPIMTKTLELRCGVNAYEPQSMTTSYTTGQRYFTTSESIDEVELSTTRSPRVDLARVISIVISRHDPATGNAESIAHVTAFDSTKAVRDLEKIRKIQGDTTRSEVPGEQGYLDIVWDHPSQEHAGTYVCEVVSLDSSQRCFTMTQSLEVRLSDPAWQDLATLVADSAKAITQLQNVTLALSESLSEVMGQLSDIVKENERKDKLIQNLMNSSHLQDQVDALERKTAGQEKIIHDLVNTIEGMQNQMDELEREEQGKHEIIQDVYNRTRNLKTQHIQSGVHSGCGDAFHTFHVPFTSIPILFIAKTGYSYVSQYLYHVHTSGVNQTGFFLKCNSYYGSASADVSLAWLAIDT